MKPKLAFIGLGAMGFPMAGHLQSAGYAVTVYNRTEERARLWAQAHGGAWAGSIRRAVEDAHAVLCCVGADSDLYAVTLGPEGALAAMQPGALLIDHTTASDTAAQRVHQAAAARDIGFVDAPVSGGQQGAGAGMLVAMCGGSDADFHRAAPILAPYCQTVEHMGGAGCGQLTKMVNQICVAGLLQALAEGLNFAQHAGIDAHKALSVISGGAAQSWQMDHRGESMLNGEFDFGFAVDWMRKDLGMCLDAAGAREVELPVTALVRRFYDDLHDLGCGGLDTSALIERLRLRQQRGTE